MIAMPMPASPQNSSSMATGRVSPVGSPIALIMKSNAVEADLGGLLDDRARGTPRLRPTRGRRVGSTFSAKSWTHFWICS